MALFFFPLSRHLLRDILGDDRMASTERAWLREHTSIQAVEHRRVELERDIHRLRLEKGGLC
ncbi:MULTISPECIES: hypothetical protein [Chromobacterium]|uniref:DUF3563 domain-containing protein n=1 Tax=Chromobacterium aquaticum TaxID=467180 RepID=A0ABV8ZQJ4_9NEIS|nr:hypothetical protein [Chromobacterium aquaticum]MCD5360784.1 hypothetical protein [Chromobacterium aquaticum]